MIDELYEDMMFKLKDNPVLFRDAAKMPNRAFGECVKSFHYFVYIYWLHQILRNKIL